MDKYHDLIINIKNGNENSFKIILNDHSKMIYKLIYQHNLESGDFMADVDNIYQEASIALYNAVFSYKEEKGMSFSSYAYMVMRAKINTCFRDCVRKYNDEYYSIDNTECIDYNLSITNLCVCENPIDYYKDKEIERVLNEFLSTLSEEDRMIFEMRKDKRPYKEISERLNINKKRVDNRLRVLRKRLKEYINE